jgi:hypothetical protein
LPEPNVLEDAPGGPAGRDLLVRPYDAARDERAWDELVRASCNGTFVQTRRFLSYHEGRFADRSLVVEDAKGRLQAVFPAAEHPDQPELISSHPGITYGGLVHDGSLRGAAMVATLQATLRHYSDLGFQRVQYKCVPHIYHRAPAEDDAYALFRLGARRSRCDLSAAIDLQRPRQLSKGRRSQRAVAQRNEVRALTGWEHAAGFWAVLEENLLERYGVRPVHTLEEILRLAEMFPENMLLLAAHKEDQLVAGGVLFCSGPVVHLQYSATNLRGRELGAGDVVVESAIGHGVEGGYRYFDYGISTERDGALLNDGLYRYKCSFGAGGVTYDQYEIQLA